MGHPTSIEQGGSAPAGVVRKGAIWGGGLTCRPALVPAHPDFLHSKVNLEFIRPAMVHGSRCPLHRNVDLHRGNHMQADDISG